MSVKIFLKLTALCSSLFYSTLSFSNQQNLPENCQQLFNIAEKIITDAKKQPGTHTQLDKIEDNFDKNKKQIMGQELAAQVKICEKGLIKLNEQNKADNSDSH